MLIHLSTLCSRYAIKPTGVLHIGAHEGEERGAYHRCGFKKVVWLEANPELAEKLAKCNRDSSTYFLEETVLNCAVSDVEGAHVDFYLANNLQSSSLRPLGSHKIFYPDIEMIRTISVVTRRVDCLFRENPRLSSDVEFAALDIQGMELEALRGFGTYLRQFKWIYTEVNRDNVYQGNALLWDIDSFLLQSSFVRVETAWTQAEWGDAFYIRREHMTPLARSRHQAFIAGARAFYRGLQFLKLLKRAVKKRLNP